MIIKITRALLLVVLASVSGCATYELEGRGSITPASERGSETIHGSLYGFRWSEFGVEKCEQGNLFRVEHHTNAALILASVVSLGLYVPQTVEWWCDGSIEDDENEEQWVPDNQGGQE